MDEFKEQVGGRVLTHLDRDSLVGADLRGADLRNVSLNNEVLIRADLVRADLAGASLIRANLSGANLSGANLVDAWLSNAVLRGARLEGAHLARCNLLGAVMPRSILAGADLEDACLVQAYLNGAVMTGAMLAGAGLADASLVGVDLTRANLTRSGIAGTNLDGAALTGALLAGATFDGYTRWPAGFEPERHGAIRLEKATPQVVFPELGIRLLPVDPAERDAGIPIDPGRSKLGGLPDWSHGDEMPRCPGCDEAMDFVGQIDSIGCVNRGQGLLPPGAYVFGDCGMIYVFFCGECNEVKAIL